MTRRQQHNIESNCVSFEDDCYNENIHAQENYQTVYNYETVEAKKLISRVYKTGVEFVRELEQKIKQII